MWFTLTTADARLSRCATEGCGGQPTERLEVDGTGANYCSGCRDLIENPKQTIANAICYGLRKSGRD